MLYRISVQDIKENKITTRFGYIVVVMQYYPRFLAKTLIHEYCRELAPDRALFTEFKAMEKTLGDHNLAFDRVEYETRFRLTDLGIQALERLSAQASDRNVYLACQCSPLQKCHGDLLLLLAKNNFHAKAQHPRVSYSKFPGIIS